MEILPGGKGDFLVKIDGRTIWDKRGRDGDFPKHDHILSLLQGA